jgi:hypothetical protein
LEDVAEAKAVFPKQLIVDVNQGCLYGVRVLYDKSIPFQDVKTTIDEHYKKWALDFNEKQEAPVKVWRVEPDRFLIQLSQANKDDEERNIIEAGTKEVIYLSAAGASACK